MMPRSQFSLGGLLGAIGWFALSLPFFIEFDDCTGLNFCIGLLLVGTATGQLFGRPLKGFLFVMGFFLAMVVLSHMLAAVFR